ncbi:hypothetical protein F8A10_12190 [Paracoccus kondratievae]|uniref:phage tail tip lysozyme n=1 Tax=Paracoccus kondratievae TaxID=135740 RepID=UPI0012667C6B|nr:phage tail tip lysozyme [Paracoccus kondratievae]QFQ88270.1 hypothetical protein F8A10_12190 [Paracoccus kondratievae]
MSNTDMRASLTVTADASALVAEMRKGSEGLREIRREAEAAARSAAVAASEQGRMAEKLNRTFSGFGASQKSARDSASVFEASREYEAFQRERAEQAARAYRSIEESLNPLIRAERELAEAQAVVNRALAEGQTSQAAANRTLAQLQARYEGFVRAQSPAAQSARAFEAAIEAEATEIRQLTLALDPAARAQAEFARVQNLTTSAVRNGTITQDEANRVMQLFEARQKAIGKGGFAMAGGLQNASYQMTDIIVQMQGGQALGLILAQQLPQLLGGFGALGAALGVVVALGAPLVTSWLTSGDAAGSLDDRLQKLEARMASVKDHMELLGNHKLDETFGSMTGDIRELTEVLLALDRAAELKQLGLSLDKILSDPIDLSFWQKLNRPLWGEGRREFTENINRGRYADITEGRGPSYDDYRARQGEIIDLAKAGKAEEAVKRVKDLVEEFTGGGPVTDLNDELVTMLINLGATTQQMAELEAFLNGTAKANAITRQIDEMVRASEQQAELSRAALKFGEDSAEVEAVRARQARENLAIQLREMKVVEGSAEELRAMAALDADLAASADLRAQARKKESDALFADLTRQGELSAAILKFGKDSAEVEALRARHAREVNDERLKEMGLAPGLLALAQKLFAVEQQRAQQIKDSEAGRKADQMSASLREQAEINRAIALHGRDSLQVKELQIAAERRAYAESLKTLQVSEERKRQLMAEWEQARGLASADPFGQIAAARGMARSQQERIQQLKLEQALLGQSEAVRSRILALWKAEQEIRRQGIDATSERARQLRETAVEEDALARSIERQKTAWEDVEAAAESAFDSILDKLMDGDWEEALEEAAKAVAGTLFDLSVRNPGKNALFGKDLPTMNDVGGLQGIWARLTGRGDGSDIAIPAPATNVGAMNVQAANVVIGGPGVMSLLAGMSGAANGAAAPGSFSGLGGADSVQAQAWQFFASKGLKPHQIAGIMGNISAESGFDPFARGDNGQAFGLFQHNDRKGKLFDFIGGAGNLGDVNRQLEFAWQELMTSENPAYRRLLASTDARSATEAFLGFERPRGFSMADPTGSEAYAKRVAAAEAALAKFGTTTQTTTADLGTLGNGMGVFGQALQGFAQGGTQGGLNALLGGLGQVVAGALGIPGFAFGGDFGGGLRIVGENGPELEFTGPSRIMNAELTRQLLSSRSSGGAANIPVAPVDTRPVINVVNNSSAEVGEIHESTDARGQRQYDLIVSDMVARGVNKRGGAAAKAFRNMGMTPAVRRRNA